MNTHKLESQARACAYAVSTVLCQVLGEGRPADRVLGGFLKANRHYGSRDRRLVSESVFAILRWWGWLHDLAPSDFTRILEQPRSNRPSAPSHAPVAGRTEDWAPLLIAAHTVDADSFPPLAPVWRRHADLKLDLKQLHAGNSTPKDRLSRLRSALTCPANQLAPTSLIPSWVPAHLKCPRKTEVLVDWLQKRPPVWLRALTGRSKDVKEELRAANIPVNRCESMPDALSIAPPRLNLRTLETFRAGLFEIQDLASQVISRVCAPQPGQRWWDACAGAGGKALHLADLMQRKGTVVATDRRTYKLKDLKLRARRSGFPNIECREWTGSPVPKRRAKFDGVLVDSPCSCSGTWRRNPDGRWTQEEAELDELVALQTQLLTAAATGVRPGGVLVYATCSMFDCENNGVVTAFLKGNPGFTKEPFPCPLTGRQTDGTQQLWPWDGDCDAMYVARFRKRAQGTAD